VTAAVVLSLCLLAFMLSDHENVSGVSETIRLRVDKWWGQERQAVGSRPESKRAMLSEILAEKAQLKRILAREDRRAKENAEFTEMPLQEAKLEKEDAKEAREAQRDVLMDEDEIEVEQEQQYRAQEAQKTRTKQGATINTKLPKAQPQKQARVRTVATEVKTAVKPKARVATPKTATKHAAKLQQLSTAKTPTVQPAPVITDKEKAAAHSQHNAQTKPVVVQKFLKKVVGARAVEKSVHNDAQEIVMEPDYQAATAVVEGLPTKRPALPLLPPLKKAEAATTHNAKHPATVHKAKKPVAMPPVSHSKKPVPEVVSPASVDSGHNLAWYLIWGTVASLCLGIVAFVLCYACNLCQGQRSSPWGLPPKRMYG